MTALRKYSTLFLFIILAVCALLLTSCDDTESEGGIIYDGTTVVGVESDTAVLKIREGTTKFSPDTLTFTAPSPFSSARVTMLSLFTYTFSVWR